VPALKVRIAIAADVEAIAGIVERAYGVYVERIGMRPGPMDADHAEKVRRGLVSVAEEGGEVVEETARAAGIDTVTLFTHEKMSERVFLSKRLG
jgi:hypothetical protein